MFKNKDYYAKLMLISVIAITALFYLFGIIEVIIEGTQVTNSYFYSLISAFLAPGGYGIPFILAMFIFIVSINLLKNKFDDKKARTALKISTVLYIAFIIFTWYLSISKLVTACYSVEHNGLLVVDLLWGIFALIALVLSFVLFFKNGFDTIYSFVLFDKDIIITKSTETTPANKEDKPLESKVDDKKPDDVKKD